MTDGKKIGFIGGGNMAEAIIKGLLAGGIQAGNIMVAEPVSQRRDFLPPNTRCSPETTWMQPGRPASSYWR